MWPLIAAVTSEFNSARPAAAKQMRTEYPQTGRRYAGFRVLRTIAAAFSPIIMDGALVFPEVSVGMIEASATRSPSMP